MRLLPFSSSTTALLALSSKRHDSWHHRGGGVAISQRRQGNGSIPMGIRTTSRRRRTTTSTLSAEQETSSTEKVSLSAYPEQSEAEESSVSRLAPSSFAATTSSGGNDDRASQSFPGGESDDETQQQQVLPAKYGALLDWLESPSIGAEISPKVTIGPSDRGGYGAFVTQPCDEGEVLFRVPREACITLQDVTSDEDCGRAFENLMQKAGPGGDTVAMAGFMAKERLKSLHIDTIGGSQEESDAGSVRFGPYLATLPWERGVNKQEHILFWSKEEIECYLEGSMCYQEAEDLCSEVNLAIQVLNGMTGKPIQIFRGEIEDESAAFKWPWEKAKEDEQQPQRPVEGLPDAVKGAFVSILTRSFEDSTSDAASDSGSNDEEQEVKMVPLLDMLQHGEEPNVAHVMKKSTDRSVLVTARRPLRAGEELLNQYRSEREESMPYHRFFTRFGFVPGIREPVLDLLRDKSSIFFAQKAEV